MTALPGVLDEAKRLIQAASERKVVLRLLGGVAIALRCPSASREGFRRDYADLDFVGHEKQSKAINEFFVAMGYEPRRRFNAMMGRRRLIFNDLSNQRRADVFLDFLEMSHKLDFSKRVELEPTTLPLADLLMTKLQIFQIEEKDFKDMAALILDHEVGPADGEAINGPYIAGLCSNSWGIQKTVTGNLSELEAVLDLFGLSSSEEAIVRSRVKSLLDLIDKQPKSLGWRLRARVGERVRWYEIPEADKPVVVSD